jgi:hypothetical protein
LTYTIDNGISNGGSHGNGVTLDARIEPSGSTVTEMGHELLTSLETVSTVVFTLGAAEEGIDPMTDGGKDMGETPFRLLIIQDKDTRFPCT